MSAISKLIRSTALVVVAVGSISPTLNVLAWNQEGGYTPPPLGVYNSTNTNTSTSSASNIRTFGTTASMPAPAVNPFAAKLSAANVTQLRAILDKIYTKGAGLTEERFITYVTKINDGIRALSKKPAYASNEVIQNITGYISFELTTKIESLKNDTSFMEEFDLLLGDYTSGTGSTGTGTTGTDTTDTTTASSRYKGCTTDDIVAANGKVVASCDATWRGNFGKGMCDAGYHIPTADEVRQAIASDRGQDEIGFGFNRIANSSLNMQSEMINGWYYTDYFLSGGGKETRRERICKQYPNSTACYPKEYPDTKNAATNNELVYEYLHVANNMFTIADFAASDMSKVTKYRNFKVRCFRDANATPSEQKASIDKYAYISNPGNGFGIVLSRAGYIHSVQSGKVNTHTTINDIAMWKKTFGEQNRAYITRELYDPIVSFLTKHPEQPFMETTGGARFKMLKDFFEYTESVKYSLKVPAIAKDFSNNSAFTQKVAKILAGEIENTNSTSVSLSDTYYGYLSSMRYGSKLSRDEQVQWYFDRMGTGIADIVNQYIKWGRAIDREAIVKTNEATYMVFDHNQMVNYWPANINSLWEQHRLNYLLNDMKDGRIKNSAEAQEIINAFLLKSPSNLNEDSTAEDRIAYAKSVTLQRDAVREKYKNRNLWCLTLEMPGQNLVDFYKSTIVGDGINTVEQLMKRDGWPTE